MPAARYHACPGESRPATDSAGSLSGSLLQNDPLLELKWVLFDFRLLSRMNTYKVLEVAQVSV